MKRKLSELHNWSKNPRGIKKEDFERLKKQISKLGQYKPLLITKDGTVLGGNMRLRAYKELGIDEVWVSVVDAPTDKEKTEYALSDNDRAGYYDKKELAKLVESVDIDLDEYKVDIEKAISLTDLFQKEEMVPAECEFSSEVLEANNYLLFYFDNIMDWNVATEMFGLDTVKSSKGIRGVGRVIGGKKLVDRS